MKLVVFTLALDAMPFITWHLPILNRLAIPWEWHVVEGVADNVGCTSWCQHLDPRLSADGTTEYLDAISYHPRVHIHRKTSWPGKCEMANTVMRGITERSLVLQVDADELWTPEQIQGIHQHALLNPSYNVLQFACRYFLGPDIVIQTRDTYGNRGQEWLRAFVVDPGTTFRTHEPPILDGIEMRIVPRERTEEDGLVFDHYAYASAAQVAFKERYYGYRNAEEHWRRLQGNAEWPVKVSDFLPWVTDGAMANILYADNPA